MPTVTIKDPDAEVARIMRITGCAIPTALRYLLGCKMRRLSRPAIDQALARAAAKEAAQKARAKRRAR